MYCYVAQIETMKAKNHSYLALAKVLLHEHTAYGIEDIALDKEVRLSWLRSVKVY